MTPDLEACFLAAGQGGARARGFYVVEGRTQRLVSGPWLSERAAEAALRTKRSA